MSTYTEAQLSLYLKHINIPNLTVQQARQSAATDPLGFLTTLQRRHMARVSFDSLALHYSKHRLLSLEPDALFDKIVVRGRGGYCMEVNAFFGIVLRSLGYVLYSAGGRVKIFGSGGGGGGWGGWYVLFLFSLSSLLFSPFSFLFLFLFLFFSSFLLSLFRHLRNLKQHPPSPPPPRPS